MYNIYFFYIIHLISKQVIYWFHKKLYIYILQIVSEDFLPQVIFLFLCLGNVANLLCNPPNKRPDSELLTPWLWTSCQFFIEWTQMNISSIFYCHSSTLVQLLNDVNFTFEEMSSRLSWWCQQESHFWWSWEKHGGRPMTLLLPTWTHGP